MAIDQVAEWQSRAREASGTAFDHRAALSLAKEIRASNARGRVSHRASQVIYLLEHVTDSDNNSDRVVNAQSAFVALQRALGGIGEPLGERRIDRRGEIALAPVRLATALQVTPNRICS